MDREDLLSIFDAFNTTNSNMCTILYNKTNIYAIGYNKFMGHVHVFRKKLNVPSIHAEVDAIRKVIYTKVSPTKKRVKLSMIVLRKNNNGKFMSSKPCMHCISFMKSKLVNSFINLREITFYEDDEFKSCSLNELTTDHVSRGWKTIFENRHR